MRIGFVSSLLWPRYGRYWTRVVTDAGAEPVWPDPEEVLKASRQRFIQAVPSTVFRLATAEAISLTDCDLIIVPHLNRGAGSTRGGGQDPWIADFPAVLEAEAGLQNLFAVPASLSAEVEPLAVTLLQQLRHDGWRTRMIMERHRSLLKPARTSMKDPQRGTVGVAGQSWLVDSTLAALAAGDGVPVMAQSALDPERLRAEALRVTDGLVPTDLEALGAVSWFSRRGGISSVIMLSDADSAVDSWLLGQARRLSSREIREVKVQDLLADGELERHLLSRYPRT